MMRSELTPLRLGRSGLVALLALAGASCADLTQPGNDFGDLTCSIDDSRIFPGGPGRDGIPALTDPAMVQPGDAGAAYLADFARVIGFEVEDQSYAVPLNIMWWHEIVNFNFGDFRIAVTHCPLTGSSLAFDREVVRGAEFGVSGLLFQNNLIMYDRTTNESLWPQMMREARCGTRDGTTLPMVPVVEMEWGEWRRLHPDTRVISENTGSGFDYNRYPYGDYDDVGNGTTLFPNPTIDDRRPPKERVLGVPDGSGGVAYPYGLLAEAGDRTVVHDEVGGESFVVLWSTAGQAAMAYSRTVNGTELTFEVQNDAFIDQETGSTWTVDGRAVGGPLAGERLEGIEEAFIAFWFAWATFYPDTGVWEL